MVEKVNETMIILRKYILEVIKIEKQKIPRCRNSSKFQSKKRRKEANSIPSTHIGRFLSWLGTGTSIKSVGVKLISCTNRMP